MVVFPGDFDLDSAVCKTPVSNLVMTTPSDIYAMTAVTLPTSNDAPKARGTFVGDFDHMKYALSNRPLHRPTTRLRPLPIVTNTELRQLAATHQPPAEWFEGEIERPF